MFQGRGMLPKKKPPSETPIPLPEHEISIYFTFQHEIIRIGKSAQRIVLDQVAVGEAA